MKLDLAKENVYQKEKKKLGSILLHVDTSIKNSRDPRLTSCRNALKRILVIHDLHVGPKESEMSIGLGYLFSHDLIHSAKQK